MRKQLALGCVLSLVLLSSAKAEFYPAPAVGETTSTFQEPYCDTADEVKQIAVAGSQSFEAMAAKYQELAAAKNQIGSSECAIAPHDTVKVLSIEGTGMVTTGDGKKYQTYAVQFVSTTVNASYWMLLFRGEKEAASELPKSG